VDLNEDEVREAVAYGRSLRSGLDASVPAPELGLPVAVGRPLVQERPLVLGDRRLVV
jgi:hypothetical protein